MFRLLVAGGRSFYDYKFIEEVLTSWFVNDFTETLKTWEDTDSGITVVHGGSPGVDRLAAMWAIYNHFIVEAHPADWKRHGKAGGPIRNKEMANSGIDYAILFPGGIGTQNMKYHLIQANINFQEAKKQLLDVGTP